MFRRSRANRPASRLLRRTLLGCIGVKYIIPLGKAVFEVLKTAARDGPFVRWQTEDSIAKQSPQLLGEFHAVIGRLIRSGQAAEEVLSQAFDTLDALKERGAASLTYGERLNILFSALSMVRPSEAGPLKITRFNEAWDKLTGEKLFVEATANMASDYRRFAAVFSELFEIMRDDWQWQPQDWLDIQGFLWIALDKTASAPPETDASPDTSESRERPNADFPHEPHPLRTARHS